MNRKIISFAALAALAASSALAQSDPRADLTQCRTRADDSRSTAQNACQPNPRNPNALQNCRARAQQNYDNALPRCQQTYDRAVARQQADQQRQQRRGY